MTENINLPDDERLDEVNEKIKIIQKKDGLTFGTDAYMLAAFMRPEHSSQAAELGSGTGIISLLATSRNKFSHIDAYEIQKEFSELAKRNIELNGMRKKITQFNTDIRNIPKDKNGYYDAVFANPPYMKSGHGKECTYAIKNIARHEEAGGIDDFCSVAARILHFGGKFFCVYRPDRLCDLIYALRKNNLEPKRMTFILPDTASAPSIVLTESKLGAASSLSVTPPLILYKSPKSALRTRVMTDEAAAVYENCRLY